MPTMPLSCFLVTITYGLLEKKNQTAQIVLTQIELTNKYQMRVLDCSRMLTI